MSEVRNWVRLTATPGIGCQAAKKLLGAFGLPDQIFSAHYSDLKRVVTERQAQALCLPPDAATLNLMEHAERWCSEENNSLVTLADNDYPALLLEIPDPPILLYVKGNPAILRRPSIAVVGSRNATAQGASNARQFSDYLSRTGLTVVSGMALGIDSAAHRGGLEGSGSTIAVIGTGADIVYPARNRELAHRIAAQGCIVSEYALSTPALAANFPRRNRIISGLSQGVLVVEAAEHSGSLITARMAAEQGREIFAIPGSIHSPLSKGCHLLIKQGAKLVETAQDIIEELRLETIGSQSPLPSGIAGTSDIADIVLTAMGFDPVHPDDLALRCNMDCGTLVARLLMLELDGHVETVAGGFYRRLI